MKAIFGACAAYALYAVCTSPAEPMLSPDSHDYLTASSLVPLGYAIVLRLLGAKATVTAQPIVFALALAWLALLAKRCTSSTALAAVMVAGIIATPQLLTFHQ